MDYKVFENLVKSQEFQCCQILDLDDNMMAVFGATNDGLPNNILIERIRKFKEDIPGTYKMKCKKKGGGSQYFQYTVNCGDKEFAKGSEQYNVTEAEITKRVKAELSNRSTNDQIKDLKSEISQLQFPMERWSYMAVSIIDKLAPNLRTSLNAVDPDIVLQGTVRGQPVPNQTPIQQNPTLATKSPVNNFNLAYQLSGQKPNNMANETQTVEKKTEQIEFTKEEVQRIQDGVTKLMKVMSVDLFEAFSNKLHNEPKLVDTLANML